GRDGRCRLRLRGHGPRRDHPLQGEGGGEAQRAQRTCGGRAHRADPQPRRLGGTGAGMRHRTGPWWAFTLLLALSLPIAGRAQGPTAIPPGWKVGQKVGFTVQRTVELHADDTTDVVSTATLAGTLTVDKRTAEHFVITYRGTPDPLPMHAEDAPQDARTDTLLRRLHARYQAVMALPVSYRVSPQGMVMAMDDPDGLMDDMARALPNAV